MNFELDENVKMVAQTARDFAEREIRPNVMEWDESQYFPVEAMKKSRRTGSVGRIGAYRVRWLRSQLPGIHQRN